MGVVQSVAPTVVAAPVVETIAAQAPAVVYGGGYGGFGYGGGATVLETVAPTVYGGGYGGVGYGGGATIVETVAPTVYGGGYGGVGYGGGVYGGGAIAAAPTIVGGSI